MSEIEEINQDEMVSNTEILERQFYFLSTVKSYLTDQLKQVDKALQNVADELNQNTPTS